MEGAFEGILSTKDSLFPTVSADWAVLPRESNRGALMGVEEQRESLKRLCPSPCEALSDEAPCVSGRRDLFRERAAQKLPARFLFVESAPRRSVRRAFRGLRRHEIPAGLFD